MTYLLFRSVISKDDAVTQCHVLIDKLNKAFGFPTADKLTLTYTIPKVHPDPNIYQAYVLIHGRCLPHLTPTQATSLATYANLHTAGWFIEISPPPVLSPVLSSVKQTPKREPDTKLMAVIGTLTALAAALAASGHFLFHWF